MFQHFDISKCVTKPEAFGTRDYAPLASLNSLALPFDDVAHISRVNTHARGKYNLSTVGAHCVRPFRGARFMLHPKEGNYPFHLRGTTLLSPPSTFRLHPNKKTHPLTHQSSSDVFISFIISPTEKP